MTGTVKRMWVALQRDNLINIRNGFFLVTAAVALIYIAVVRWIIPAETSLKPELYIVDRTGGQAFAVRAFAEDEENKVRQFEDVNAMQAQMRENQNSVGVLLNEGEPLPEVELYFQGHENAKVRRLLAVSVEDELRRIYEVPFPGAASVETAVLRTEGSDEKVPFNLYWVPVMLFSDAGVIGLLFIAVLIFMEKEEGTLKAYLVTPGRSWEYLLSKALALAFLAVLFALVFTALTLGFKGPNYLHLTLVMAAAALFSALLGAWAAVYFDNISQFFFPAVLLILALGLPGVAYFAPSFSPLWVRLIPSYPLVFGLREAVFPSGNPQIVVEAVLIMLGVNLVLLALASRAFNRQIAYR